MAEKQLFLCMLRPAISYDYVTSPGDLKQAVLATTCLASWFGMPWLHLTEAHCAAQMVASSRFDYDAEDFLERCQKKKDPIALGIAKFHAARGWTAPRQLAGPTADGQTRMMYDR